MTNLGYIIAAYVITLGTLAGYALLLWHRMRVADRQAANVLTMPNLSEEGGHGRQ